MSTRPGQRIKEIVTRLSGLRLRDVVGNRSAVTRVLGNIDELRGEIDAVRRLADLVEHLVPVVGALAGPRRVARKGRSTPARRRKAARRAAAAPKARRRTATRRARRRTPARPARRARSRPAAAAPGKANAGERDLAQRITAPLRSQEALRAREAILAPPFSPTPFILEAVRAAGSEGVRPRDVVAKVNQAAPGHHVRPSALVSTILSRLAKKDQVQRRGERYYAR